MARGKPFKKGGTRAKRSGRKGGTKSRPSLRKSRKK